MAVANVMAIDLYEHQKIAIENLRTGSILCGGVGSGKSRTAIAYYFIKECQGNIKINGIGDFSEMKKPKDLYIITTAKKRDTFEWEHECAPFALSTKKNISVCGVSVIIDSWNNISKYVNIENSFFIFDEQRLIGSGIWVKSFIKIANKNNWILLSATPGDTWSDYIPVFIANNFYKNRTQFLRRHAVYSRFSKFPKIEKYIETEHLIKLRNKITVMMNYEKPTIAYHQTIIVDYNQKDLDNIFIRRWNIFKNKPIKSISELCYLMRKVVNVDPSRIKAIKKIINQYDRIIIFYNFDYELELLRKLGEELNIITKEWNGHKHESVPKDNKWLYLVQYSAGAEGWNCIDTNVIIFFSQNYSYKIMVQSAGRIDRINTTYKKLFYYHIRSNSSIDRAINKALKKKKNFNISSFCK